MSAIFQKQILFPDIYSIPDVFVERILKNKKSIITIITIILIAGIAGIVGFIQLEKEMNQVKQNMISTVERRFGFQLLVDDMKLRLNHVILKNVQLYQLDENHPAIMQLQGIDLRYNILHIFTGKVNFIQSITRIYLTGLQVHINDITTPLLVNLNNSNKIALIKIPFNNTEIIFHNCSVTYDDEHGGNVSIQNIQSRMIIKSNFISPLHLSTIFNYNNNSSNIHSSADVSLNGNINLNSQNPCYRGKMQCKKVKFNNHEFHALTLSAYISSNAITISKLNAGSHIAGRLSYTKKQLNGKIVIKSLPFSEIATMAGISYTESMGYDISGKISITNSQAQLMLTGRRISSHGGYGERFYCNAQCDKDSITIHEVKLLQSQNSYIIGQNIHWQYGFLPTIQNLSVESWKSDTTTLQGNIKSSMQNHTYSISLDNGRINDYIIKKAALTLLEQHNKYTIIKSDITAPIKISGIINAHNPVSARIDINLYDISSHVLEQAFAIKNAPQGTIHGTCAIILHNNAISLQAHNLILQNPSPAIKQAIIHGVYNKKTFNGECAIIDNNHNTKTLRGALTIVDNNNYWIDAHIPIAHTSLNLRGSIRKQHATTYLALKIPHGGKIKGTIFTDGFSEFQIILKNYSPESIVDTDKLQIKKINGYFRLSGFITEMESMKGNGYIDVENINVGNITIDKIEAWPKWKRNELIIQDGKIYNNARINYFSGYIDFTKNSTAYVDIEDVATVKYWTGPLGNITTIDIKKMSVDYIRSLYFADVTALNKLHGEIHGELRIKEKDGNNQVHGYIELHDGSFNNQPIKTAKINIHSHNDKIIFNNSSFHTGDNGILNINTAKYIPKSKEFFIRGKAVRYTYIFPITSDFQIEGRIEAHDISMNVKMNKLTINKMTFNKLEHFISFDKKNNTLVVQSYNKNGIEGLIELDDTRKSIKALQVAMLQQQKPILKIHGAIQDKKYLDIDISSSSLELKDFLELIPGVDVRSDIISPASGNVIISMKVKGTTDIPLYYGTIKIIGKHKEKGARITFGLGEKPFIFPLREGYGELIFNGDNIEISDSSQVRIGDGYAYFSGQLDLLKGKISYVDIDIRSDKKQGVRIMRKGLLDGDAIFNINFTGQPNDIFCSGIITAHDLEFTLPQPPLQSTSPSTENKKINIDTDVTILVGNNVSYYYDPSGVIVQAAPEGWIHIDGEINNSGGIDLDGQIDGLNTGPNKCGTINYLGEVFTVTSVSFEMVPGQEKNLPYIKAEAEKIKGQHYFYLSIDGIIDNNLVPQLSSQSMLDEHEIFEYLGFSKYTSESSDEAIHEVLNQGMRQLFNLGEAKVVRSQVSAVRRKLGMDYLSVRTHIIENVTMGLMNGEMVEITPESYLSSLKKTEVAAGWVLGTDILSEESALFLTSRVRLEQDEAGDEKATLLPPTAKVNIGLQYNIKGLSVEYGWSPLTAKRGLYSQNTPTIENRFSVQWQKRF